MKFLLNESVRLACKEALNDLGYDAEHAAHLSLQGEADEIIYQEAFNRSSIFITRDAHFANPIRFPADGTKGIIYLRKGI